METRKVTMEQAQDEALVFGVDDGGEFYGKTAEGERLEIAEPATIMCDEGPEDHSGEVAEMVSVQHLLAEARALQAMLPGNGFSKTARIVFNGSTHSDGVDVWISCRVFSDNLQVFTAPTVAEAVAEARNFIEKAPEARRGEVARRMAPAIMDAVADFGTCTAAHLMAAGFTADNISLYGIAACERAQFLAGGRPFFIGEG